MSDILKQIQALQEQFSNLFEVDGDGLGQPAVDVPPSQNKIKRDRKTKDGKVEVVSVEDELFPYDGNKREQYRQKIIDTINNMIQGTATLEDLLQIVRQKKAPLKEAMELMEELLGESSHKRKYGNPNAVDYVEGVGTKFVKDYVQKHPEAVSNQDFNDEYNPGEHRQEGIVKQRLEQKIKDNPIGRYTENLKKAAREHSGRDTLKEAIEILEAIKDDVKNHKKYTGGTATFSYKGNDYSYTPEKGLKKEGQSKDERNPIQKVVDSSNKEFDKAREYNYNTERQSRNIGKKINKEVKKLEKSEGKGAFPGKTNDTIKKLIDTANVISANKADADKNFQEINKRQQDMADNAKGVKHQMYNVWTSKNKDSYGFKPVVQTSEALEEAFKLISSIVEASPFATKRRIADQFKDKMDDKLSKAYSNVKKTLQKMNDVDKEVREKGGETVAFTGDKITDFSKDPEVKKKQEEFNQATDDMHKASAKCDKVHHLRNLVRHYQTPEMADEALKEAMELMEDVYDAVLKSVDDENSPLRKKNIHGKINLERWMETIRNNKKKELETSAEREGVTPRGLAAKRGETADLRIK